MRLVYTKNFNQEGEIEVILRLEDYTLEEQEALKVIGEPWFSFVKTYPLTNTSVEFENVCLSDFQNVKMTFKTKKYDMLLVQPEVDSYIADIKELLRCVMDDLMAKYQRFIETGSTEEVEDEEFGYNNPGHVHLIIGDQIPDRMNEGDIFGQFLPDSGELDIVEDLFPKEEPEAPEETPETPEDENPEEELPEVPEDEVPGEDSEEEPSGEDQDEESPEEVCGCPCCK